ncbi:hypothetical protein HDZ31DRAFT_59966 [Schizophyllum fasciatum]
MRFALVATLFALVGVSIAGCPFDVTGPWCSQQGCRTGGDCNPKDACTNAGPAWSDQCGGGDHWVCDPEHKCN